MTVCGLARKHGTLVAMLTPDTSLHFGLWITFKSSMIQEENALRDGRRRFDDTI